MKTPLLKQAGLAALGLLVSFQASAAEIQRLDASVASSVITTGSGVITNWLDQSGSTNNASPAIGSVKYPSTTLFPTNLAGAQFGPTRSSLTLFASAASDQWLDQRSGTNGFCVLVAFKVSAINNEWNDLLGNSSAVSSGFGLRYGSTGIMTSYLGGTTIQKSTTEGYFPVVAGDTVVFGFNYNAVLDTAEFWDSKNYSSLFGRIAHADFSNASSVTLGSMGSSARFFNGNVGEVRVFNRGLNPTEFKAVRETLAAKWVGIPAPAQVSWRSIAEDPLYPEDDALVAGIVIGDPGFANPLPANPATQDCTATFQEALNAMSAAGGGTVYVPPGHYCFTGNLFLPDGVILRGRWKAPSATQPVIGTILDIYTGRGVGSTGTAFLNSAGAECGIRNLAFWYPEQAATAIVPYPFTVANTDAGMTTIENITLVNSYLGMNLSKAAFECLRGVYGTPMALGFYIDGGTAVPRFEGINISASYWAWSGLAGSPSVGGPQASFMLSSGTGMDIRNVDGGYYKDNNVDGYLCGIRFARNDSGENSGGNEFYNVNATNCAEALRLDSIIGLRAFKCTFRGNTNGVHRVADRGAEFYNCTISGSTNSLLGDPGSLTYTMALQNCSMTGKISLGSNASLQLVSSPFSTTGTNIVLNTGVAQALVAGCTNGGPSNIQNNSGAPSNLIVISTDPVTTGTLPTFPSYTKTRKPDKLDLFLVTNPVYAGGAKGDAITDDTAAIQAALTAATANGGGIVFFPAGIYRVTSALSVSPNTVAKGVELRGIFGGRHGNDNLGSMILIATGAGDANGTPFISLGDHCGIRGMNFNYVTQNWMVQDMIPYPYMIRAQGGALNYVIDCCVGNVYQGIDFNNARQGLVDYCFFGGLSNTYRVRGGSSNCRIQNTHVKPLQWWITNNPIKSVNPTPEQIDMQVGQTSDVFIVESTTSLSIFSVFNHLSRTLFTQRGGSGQALFMGGERLQRGYVMETAPTSGTFSFIGGDTTVNQAGDRTGSFGWWLKDTYNGTVTSWGNTILNGGCDHLIAVDGTNGSFIANGLSTSQKLGIAGIWAAGSVTLNNVNLSERFSLDVETGGQFNALRSLLPPMSNQTQLGATSYTHCIIPNTYIAADTNEDPYRPIGVTMDTSNVAPIDVALFTEAGLTRSSAKIPKTGYHLTSGTSFGFDVTDPEFANGSNPAVTIEICYLEDTNGSITVAYDSTNGMVNKATYTLSASTAAWKTQTMTVTNARFAAADGRDITITTSGGADPVILYVVVQSAYLGAP